MTTKKAPIGRAHIISYLPASLKQELEQWCHAQHVSVSTYVHTLIKNDLAKKVRHG